jgi:hypothetical protein
MSSLQGLKQNNKYMSEEYMSQEGGRSAWDTVRAFGP